MQALRNRCSFLALLLLTAVPASASQREAQSTRPKLDFTPFEGSVRWAVELIPILAGDLVLATTTLRLFAFDASTAELRWSAGPPEGWNELEPATRERLFDGLNPRRPWIAPAAGNRVAVAALQVPVSRHKGEEWQGITIMTALPERRLFAFDLGTGRPLWNHAPPPDWDGESGPHPQRMSLIGSPTVVGGCVLAASWSDLSSVDYHVSCYYLATGALLWSTFVVRGQVEHNMFGRAVFEFTGAPVVAVPGQSRVLVQTGLGLIAALDLATGAILWRSEYETIPLPKTRSYTPPRREYVWRMTPPFVAGNVVLATPPDSRDLLALDITDGHLLWKAANSALSTLEPTSGEIDLDHLIGFDGNVIYLGGTRPAAFLKPDGMESVALRQLWHASDLQGTIGRGQLARDGLFVLCRGECLVYDRETGQSRGSLELGRRPRGSLVTDEAFYALTDDGLERIER